MSVRIKPTPEQIRWRRAFHAARHEHAWLLRCEGLTLRAIGERLGLSRNRPFQMLEKKKRQLLWLENQRKPDAEDDYADRAEWMARR